MMVKSIFMKAIFFFLLVIVACGKKTSPVTTVFPRPAEDALTQSQAESRKARVSNIHYQLEIDLVSQTETFHGIADIAFELSDKATPLTLDFSDGSIDRVTLNSEPITPSYNGYFIILPIEQLKIGKNTVSVSYLHPYSKDGTGLHRFTDPGDGNTYLYTYLWPYYANRLFPAFDQPNLKATFDLSVTAPKGWEVVSTASGSVVSETDAGAIWQFATTPRMSTYIFSLHAGPYQIWQDMAGHISLRLLARQSLATYVATEEWFDITKRGLTFYGDYFESPYPFGKYDQLIVPDFNIGAMENIAAVTFGERYVQRQPSDYFQRQRRAGTILHEMAHMWFGNLVTKNWWNGLWLNESFATFMANTALVRATEFSDAWHGFFTGGKLDAYYADSRVTTHPIEVPVNSTADFFSVFDNITYQKGSSVLKQLEFFVGEDNHRRGVANYLKQHAYGNTDLADFIDEQSRTAGLDLNAWAEEWLYSKGFNTLTAELVCDAGKVRQLRIVQTAPREHPQSRHHRIEIAFYNRNEADELTLQSVWPLQVAGESTVIEAVVGEPCPALVFPNHNDHTFAKVHLDEASFSALKGHIHEIKDPLARSMMWQTLLDLTAAGQFPLDELMTEAITSATKETNIRVIDQLLRAVTWAHDRLQRLAPDSDVLLRQIDTKLQTQVWQQLNAVAAGSDLQKRWFGLFVSLGAGGENHNRMRRLLKEEMQIPGLSMSQDLRWQLVVAIAAQGGANVQTIIDVEKARDNSDYGEKLALAADAALPNADNKKRWLKELQNPESPLGLAKQRQIIFSLFPSHQTQLQIENLDTILASLAPLSASKDNYFLASYTSGLLRPMGQQQSVSAMAAALKSGEKYASSTLKFLKEAHQADEECLELRKSVNSNR